MGQNGLSVTFSVPRAARECYSPQFRVAPEKAIASFFGT